MRILIYIIIILLFINFIIGSQLLNGNWISTNDFTEQCGAQLLLNLKNHVNRSAKLVMIPTDSEPIIIEGKMLFIGSPHNIFYYKNAGIVKTSGFENILPSLLYYKFNINGDLILYRNKIYGCFAKICDI
jgi:hypothetical protein